MITYFTCESVPQFDSLFPPYQKWFISLPVVLASLETLQNRSCLVCIDQLASDPTNVELIFDTNTDGHSATASKWCVQQDADSGKEYYVNNATQESMWVKPAELGVQERMIDIGTSRSVGRSVGRRAWEREGGRKGGREGGVTGTQRA